MCVLTYDQVRGVKGISLAEAHVTVTKDEAADWLFLTPNIKLAMSQYF